MPYKKISDVPANIKTHKGVALNLEQANFWASVYDAVLAESDEENKEEISAAIAWTKFVEKYEIITDEENNKTWITKKGEEKMDKKEKDAQLTEVGKALIKFEDLLKKAEGVIGKSIILFGKNEEIKVDEKTVRILRKTVELLKVEKDKLEKIETTEIKKVEEVVAPETSGAATPPAAEEEEEAPKPFAQRMKEAESNKKINDAQWAFQEYVREVLNSKVTDKVALIQTAVTELGTFLESASAAVKSEKIDFKKKDVEPEKATEVKEEIKPEEKTEEVKEEIKPEDIAKADEEEPKEKTDEELLAAKDEDLTAEELIKKKKLIADKKAAEEKAAEEE